MMEGYLYSASGKRTKLPPWLGWRLKRTGTVPCDSFEGMCIWEQGPLNELKDADRLVLEENGQRRFTGILDEYELSWGMNGGVITISARGLAALLLDNEAVGQDYQMATLADILSNHVTPWGVSVGQVDTLQPVQNFSVTSGSSEWQVLDSFARYHNGVQPRMDVYGRLWVTHEDEEREFVIDDRTGVTEAVWRDRRCKVYSEVLVRPRGLGQSQRVVNREFLAQGGRRRRVITMPRKSGYQAMRFSGRYQLMRSAQQRKRLELTVPGTYFCEPGERVRVELTKPSIFGSWTVLETEAVLNQDGSRVKLTLGDRYVAF